MQSHHFTSNRWGKVETVADLIHMGSKVAADSDCSHEFKRHLFLRRKNIINLDTILKSRDITLPTKVPIVKAVVFPVVMYGCVRWTIKKAEKQTINAFKLRCWKRFLRVSWTAKKKKKKIKPVHPKGNQPWIFIGRTDAEVDAPILWPLDAKSRLTGKDPDTGKDWRQGEWGGRGCHG